MKNGLSVLLAGVMATSLFGCSSNEPKEQVKLTIAAAASLENAFEDELIPMFEHGSYKQSKRIYKKMLEMFKAIPQDRTQIKIRIGIVGEIYMKYSPLGIINT